MRSDPQPQVGERRSPCRAERPQDQPQPVARLGRELEPLRLGHGQPLAPADHRADRRAAQRLIESGLAVGPGRGMDDDDMLEIQPQRPGSRRIEPAAAIDQHQRLAFGAGMPCPVQAERPRPGAVGGRQQFDQRPGLEPGRLQKDVEKGQSRRAVGRAGRLRLGLHGANACGKVLQNLRRCSHLILTQKSGRLGLAPLKCTFVYITEQMHCKRFRAAMRRYGLQNDNW